jgi:Tfp pilus assembly protein PilW
MNITTVKLQNIGWLVNDNTSVPNDPNNSDCVAVLAWIEEGNTPAPQFTDEEIAANTQEVTNATSRAYLASTDWYIVRRAETSEGVPSDIITARAAARDAIV